MSKYRKLKKINHIVLNIDSDSISDYNELKLIIRKYYIQTPKTR